MMNTAVARRNLNRLCQAKSRISEIHAYNHKSTLLSSEQKISKQL